MAKLLSIVYLVATFIVAAIALVSTSALATYTHTEDLHYEGRISKAILSSTSLDTHSIVAVPFALGSKKNLLDSRAPDDDSYYSLGFSDEHHKPNVSYVIENGALVKISVTFPAPYSLTMPAFTIKVLTVRADYTIPDKYYRSKRNRLPTEELNEENDGLSFDERKYEMIMEETLVTPNAQSDAANFALHDATPLEDLYDYVVAIINVHPRIVTSFVYELEGIPDEIYQTGKMYDLTPFNSTMHMKFVAKYDEKEDALGVWVVRRPPIPDFTLLVSVDDKIEMTHSVADPSPAGQGFPEAVRHAKSRRNAVYRIVVHFYERPRQEHICFPIDKDFKKEMEEKLAGPDNHRKFIEQAVPKADGFKLRFTNDNHKDSLTVSLVQPHPISSLMVSMYVSYDGKKAPYNLRHDDAKLGFDDEEDTHAERPILVFREEEHHVPYIGPTETNQFGWYSALPMKAEALVRLADARTGGKAARVASKSLKLSEDDGEKDDEAAAKKDDDDTPIPASRLEHIHLSACVSFNKKEGSMHPFEEMGEWIYDFGGDVKKLAVVTTTATGAKRHSRLTKDNKGLAAREDIPQNGDIGAIPYRLLLTTTTVEANEWVAEVMKNATAFVTKAVELGMDVQQNQHFMLMTFFMLMQPSSAFDGTNWRHYFDTIPLGTKPSIPIFLTEAETKLLTSFSPLMAEHVRTMKQLIAAEYKTIADQVPWFEKEVSEEKYTIARSQVENRVFNISGTLVMIPALDYLSHADDPSVALSFDDREQLVQMQARHTIPSGAPLTIDYGVQSRNKFDFFTQFGFIPTAAADVADLRLHRFKAHVDDADEYANVFLTATTVDSRNELVIILREDLAAAKSQEEGDTVSPTMITQTEVRNALVALLKKELAAMPKRETIAAYAPAADAKDAATEGILEVALALYDGRVKALEAHMAWAADTKTPLF